MIEDAREAIAEVREMMANAERSLAAIEKGELSTLYPDCVSVKEPI